MHRLPDIRTYRGKVYRYLMYRYMQYRERDAVLKIFNEGSSRSGKTYDAFDFLYDICTLALSPLNIFVYRNTLQACKEITLADFRKKLTLRGVYDPDAMRSENQHPDYYINNSVIHFRGLDRMDSREGYDCDIIYINEMLDDISKQQYKNITMRCTTMVIGDWNPKYTEHWAFELEGQPHTYFTHTTYKEIRSARLGSYEKSNPMNLHRRTLLRARPTSGDGKSMDWESVQRKRVLSIRISTGSMNFRPTWKGSCSALTSDLRTILRRSSVWGFGGLIYT